MTTARRSSSLRLTWPGEDIGHDYSSQSPVLFTLEKHAFSGFLFKLTVLISCVLCSRRSITESVFLVPIMEEADLSDYSGLAPLAKYEWNSGSKSTQTVLPLSSFVAKRTQFTRISFRTNQRLRRRLKGLKQNKSCFASLEQSFLLRCYPLLGLRS